MCILCADESINHSLALSMAVEQIKYRADQLNYHRVRPEAMRDYPLAAVKSMSQLVTATAIAVRHMTILLEELDMIERI